MSYRKQDWPLTPEQLAGVIALGETTLVEFKREWWNGENADGKRAKITRAVLALSNTVTSDELGLLIIGVEDKTLRICPLTDAPTPEAVQQVLGGLITPPPSIACRHSELPEGRVSAIAVFSSGVQPHTAIREFPGVLSTRDVYVRRGEQVGVLTMPELRRMFREHDASAAMRGRVDPIQFGFVSLDQSSLQRLSIRVQNVLDEPVADVSVSFDAHLIRDPETCARCVKFGPATLEAGSVHEVTIRLDEFQFYKTAWDSTKHERHYTHIRDMSHVGDRWFDVTLNVQFRDADGFLRCRSETMPLAW